MQQFLNFFPLPQGQGSLRPTRCWRLRIGSGLWSTSVPSMAACCCCGDLAGRRGVLVDRLGLGPGRADEALVELLHAEDQVGHALAHRGPHLLEDPHALALVFDLGIDLGVAAQADAAAQVVHRQQVVFPGGVEQLQHQRPLHLPHFRAVAVLDGRRPGGARAARRSQRQHLVRRQLVVQYFSASQAESSCSRAVVVRPRRRPSRPARRTAKMLVEPGAGLRPWPRWPACVQAPAVLDQQRADLVALLVLQVLEAQARRRTGRGPSATSSSRS